MDTYARFEDLRRSEQGNTFTLRLREGCSDVAVLAPHGGGIEPGTSEIAEAVAGSEHTFYAFEGARPSGNRVLHLASTHFDEPLGLAAARRAGVVITIHGCEGEGEIVHVGGRNASFRERLCHGLREAGFAVDDSPVSRLRGHHPDNLCNQGGRGPGVQLEISRGLRRRMFGSLEPDGRKETTPVLDAFVAAVRRGIRDLEHQAR